MKKNNRDQTKIGKAKEDKTKEGKTEEGKAKEDKTEEGKAKEDKTEEGKAKEEIIFDSSMVRLSRKKNKKGEYIYFKNNEELKKEINNFGKQEGYSKNDFNYEITKEVEKFIGKRFDNIVFLAGAGTSVIMTENGDIDSKYGKTMKGIAKIIYDDLSGSKEPDSEDLYSLMDFAKVTHYKNLSIDSNDNKQKKDENNKNKDIKEKDENNKNKDIKVKDENNKNKDIKEKDENNKNKDIKEKEKFLEDFDLENFLSNVIRFEPYVNEDKESKGKYKNTKNKILEIIKENTQYPYDTNSDKEVLSNHIALLNILSNMVEAPNKLSVVTTNYDTFFEDAAAEANYTVFDGFKFLSKPEFDSDMFNWNLVKEVPNIKTRELEYNKRVFNLIKIHGSRNWERTEENKIVRVAKNESSDSDKTVMIFPSSEKYAQSYQEPYFDLFTKFQELLKRENTLLITAGFSFSDNHIFRMVKEAVINNKELALLVTDYDIEKIEKKNRNWKDLQSLKSAYPKVAFLKATLNKDLIRFLGGSSND